MQKQPPQFPRIDFEELNKIGLDPSNLGHTDITKVDDENLGKAILWVWSRCPGNYKWDATANFLLAETNRRLLVSASKAADKTGRISLWISLLALALAGASLFVSLLDFQSGNEWQRKEIEILEKLSESANIRDGRPSPSNTSR